MLVLALQRWARYQPAPLSEDELPAPTTLALVEDIPPSRPVGGQDVANQGQPWTADEDVLPVAAPSLGEEEPWGPPPPWSEPPRSLLGQASDEALPPCGREEEVPWPPPWLQAWPSAQPPQTWDDEQVPFAAVVFALDDDPWTPPGPWAVWPLSCTWADEYVLPGTAVFGLEEPGGLPGRAWDECVPSPIWADDASGPVSAAVPVPLEDDGWHPPVVWTTWRGALACLGLEEELPPLLGLVGLEDPSPWSLSLPWASDRSHALLWDTDAMAPGTPLGLDEEGWVPARPWTLAQRVACWAGEEEWPTPAVPCGIEDDGWLPGRVPAGWQLTTQTDWHPWWSEVSDTSTAVAALVPVGRRLDMHRQNARIDMRRRG
jgi:hypothetical protein